MESIDLKGGSYTAKSLIAGCQRCVNLFPEANQDTAPTPFTYYQRYGLKSISAAIGLNARGSYRATNGELYEVIGTNVYFTDSTFTRTLLGTIAAGSTPVCMVDNGQDGGVLVIVDGTVNGYVVTLSGHAFSTISDAAFYGSTRVEYMDTYFVFNRPGTTQWYLSPQHWNGTDPFDALDIADKVGGADNLAVAACNAGNVQLIGLLTTEIWYNAANVDFVFARVPSVFIEHGTPAAYSVAQNDVGTYFLSQDDDGGCIFLKIVGYEAKRFSTHAIEAEISTYSTVADCIAQTYQIEGHAFVKFSFPTADKTWVWDESQGLWHEETWIDSNGEEHMHRGVFTAYAYTLNVMQDWQDGTLYQQDVNTFIDETTVPSPIVWRRGFPHMLNAGKRVSYSKFIANMQAGAAPGLLTTDEPLISMRYSDTRGYTWSDPVTTGIGSTGEYDRWPTYWQLGMAQDRVFEIFWDAPYATALMGAFVELEAAET